MMPFLFFSKHLLHSSPFYSCCVFVFSHFHFLRVEGVFLILRERETHTHPLHDEITELTRRHRRERNTLQEITRSEIYYVLSSKMDKIGVFPPPFTYTVLLIFELAFNRCCQTVQFSCFLHFLYTASLYFLRDEASKRILQWPVREGIPFKRKRIQKEDNDSRLSKRRHFKEGPSVQQHLPCNRSMCPDIYEKKTDSEASIGYIFCTLFRNLYCFFLLFWSLEQHSRGLQLQEEEKNEEKNTIHRTRV